MLQNPHSRMGKENVANQPQKVSFKKFQGAPTAWLVKEKCAAGGLSPASDICAGGGCQSNRHQPPPRLAEWNLDGNNEAASLSSRRRDGIYLFCLHSQQDLCLTEDKTPHPHPHPHPSPPPLTPSECVRRLHRSSSVYPANYRPSLSTSS